MPKVKHYFADVYGDDGDDDQSIREISASTYAELARLMPQRVWELRPEMFPIADLDFPMSVCVTTPLVGEPLDVVVADLLAGYNVFIFYI